MNSYELVFIVSPEISDEDVPKVVDKVTGLITGKGGSVAETNQWGRRKLAYPVKKHVEGNYILSRFSLAANMVKEVEGTLRVSNEILRHVVVRMPEVVES